MSQKLERKEKVDVYADELTRRYHAGEIRLAEAVNQLASYEHWRDDDWTDPSSLPEERVFMPLLKIRPKPRRPVPPQSEKKSSYVNVEN